MLIAHLVFRLFLQNACWYCPVDHFPKLSQLWFQHAPWVNNISATVMYIYIYIYKYIYISWNRRAPKKVESTRNAKHLGIYFYHLERWCNNWLMAPYYLSGFCTIDCPGLMTINWKPLQITAMCQCGEEKGVASSLNKNSVYRRSMNIKDACISHMWWARDLSEKNINNINKSLSTGLASYDRYQPRLVSSNEYLKWILRWSNWG